MVHEEDQRPALSAVNQTPSSYPLWVPTQERSEFVPPQGLMGSAPNVDELGLGNSSVTSPLKSTAASEESPSHRTNRRSWSRKGTKSSASYWTKKKLETLSTYFNPIPFPSKARPLDIATHQILLTRLGLWEFLNLDFGQKIRSDLVKELVVCYKRNNYHCKSRVHGMTVILGRTALADALHLPAKRFNLKAEGDGEDGNFMVSQEEASFLEELIWGWLVLKDDDSVVVDDYILQFNRSMKEMRFGNADWARLIWFMVERELSKGQHLVNCYYASHLQLLLMHQRPELFGNHVDTGTSAGFSFDQKLKKEICSSVGKYTVGLKGRENEKKKENVIVKCHKRRREFFEKKEEKICTEENVISDDEGEKLRKQNAELVGRKFRVRRQMTDENQDQHQPCLLYEGENESKKGRLTDLGCTGTDFQAINWARKADNTGKVPKSNSAMDSLMHQQSHEVGLKIEGSTDLIISSMDDLNREEIEHQPSNFISCVEGETNLHSGDKVEHVVTGKVGHGSESEKESTVVHGKSEDEVIQVLLNEEDVLNAEKHAIDCDMALKETDYMGKHTNSFPKTDRENAEPKVSHVNDFQICVSVKNMEVTLDAFQGTFGCDNVEERKNEEVMDLDCGGSRLVHCKKESGVMEDEASDEAECVANVGNSHVVPPEIEDEATGAECQASTGHSIHVQCKKKDVGMEDKAGIAVFEANVGNSVEVLCEKKAEVMEDKAAECEANIGNSILVQCEKEDEVMEDKAAECAANIDHSHVVHFEDDVIEDEAAGAQCRANIDESNDVHCKKQDEANEASFEVNVGNSLELHAHNDVIEDEALGAEHEASIVKSIDVHCKKIDDVMEDKVNKSSLEVNAVYQLEMHFKKDDNVMEDRADEAEGEAKIGNLHGVHCEVDEATGAECEANIGDSINVSKAAFKANIGNSLELHSEKEGVVMEDETNGAACETSISNSLKEELKNIDLVSEKHNVEHMNTLMQRVKQQEPSLFEYSESGEGNVELQECGLNEFVADGMDLQVTSNEHREIIQTSEGFLQHCTTSNVNESQVPKEALPAQYPQEKCHHMESLYSADVVELTSRKEVICNLPNYNIDHSLFHGSAQRNKDINGTEVASETQMGTSLVGFNCENHSHYGHGAETENTIDSTDESGEGLMDIDFCTQQVELWMARVKNAARRKVQVNNGFNEILLQRVEEQNQIIQQYEMMMRKEQQQKQKNVRKYERELHLMQSVVQDYRKALKEVRSSFAKYRERCQLPEESVYMDHPGGGGRVILVEEWKKLKEEEEKNMVPIIKAMVENFEEEWIGKLEAHLGYFDCFCDRLEDLGYAVSRLRAEVLKP